MGQKNSKGTVSITDAKGRIRLRWRYSGERYSLNLSFYSKSNLLQAKKVALSIENDIALGNFDSSLIKYTDSKTPNKKKESLVDLFCQWVTKIKNRDIEKDLDYYLTKRMLERWKGFNPEEALANLSFEKIAAKTYNARLRVLQGFYSWLVKCSIINMNPFEDVEPKKVKRAGLSKRKPFTLQEIQMILKAFKSNTYCPKCSYYKHSFYYPFIYFLFQTGVRPAEAIGLRVENVSLEEKKVMIKEALARSMKGTNAGARQMKETKNGKERILPLSSEMLEVLRPLIDNKPPDHLVFTSPKGLAIDDRMFQRRIFRTVLKGLNLEPRVLYACRHTFASRCIESGMTPVMTAFLLGNNAETALRNYTHLIELPKSLPMIGE